jgi:hypothetical protein
LTQPLNYRGKVENIQMVSSVMGVIFTIVSAGFNILWVSLAIFGSDHAVYKEFSKLFSLRRNYGFQKFLAEFVTVIIFLAMIGAISFWFPIS